MWLGNYMEEVSMTCLSVVVIHFTKNMLFGSRLAFKVELELESAGSTRAHLQDQLELESTIEFESAEVILRPKE